MRFSRTLAALTSGAVVTAGVVLPPTASAQLGVIRSEVRTVNHPCESSGTGGNAVTLSPNDINVTYPEAVKPGEVFTATIHPGQMTSGWYVGRFTYVIALPPNVDLVGLGNGGGDSGLRYSEGRSLLIENVNASGNPDWDGPLVKISGGMTPYFGGDEDIAVWPSSAHQYGMNVTDNSPFRLPKVEVRLRAPVDRSVQQIGVGLHGTTSGQNRGDSRRNNAIQYAHQSVLGGARIWYCGRTYPSGWNALTRTNVTTDAPIVATTETHWVGGDRTVADNQQTEFIARVDVDGASERERAYAPVTFRRTDTGAVLGTAVPDRVTGEARITRAFQGTIEGYSFDVVAEYAGVKRGGIQSIHTSSTGSLGVTVAPNQVRYPVNITGATRLPDSGGQVPVRIATTISSPNGTYPAGLQAQLYRDGVPVGQPQQAAQNLTFQDTVPRSVGEKTYHYTVRLNSVVIGNWSHSGESASSVGVVFSGPSPTEPVDLDFVDLPVDPDFIFVPGGSARALEIGAGSLGSLSPWYYGMS